TRKHDGPICNWRRRGGNLPLGRWFAKLCRSRPPSTDELKHGGKSQPKRRPQARVGVRKGALRHGRMSSLLTERVGTLCLPIACPPCEDALRKQLTVARRSNRQSVPASCARRRRPVCALKHLHRKSGCGESPRDGPTR